MVGWLLRWTWVILLQESGKAIEPRRPEPFLFVVRDEGIDDDQRIRELCVDGADLGAPLLGVIPLGMRRRPAPQPRPELLDLHACKTYPGPAGR